MSKKISVADVKIIDTVEQRAEIRYRIVKHIN